METIREIKLAACTRQTIIAIEQGKSVPPLDPAFRICRAFGVPLERVFQHVVPLSLMLTDINYFDMIWF
jgi:DNA-binding XRE family transcriptional regulator